MISRGLAGVSVLMMMVAALAITPSAGAEDFVPGEVIVRYSADSTGVERTEVRRQSGVTSTSPLLLSNAQVVETGPGQSVAETIAGLEDDPAVLYAEPNYIEEVDAEPNDALFGNQWADRNTGQLINGISGTAGADMSAIDGWNIALTSPDVPVAIFDTGTTGDHPDLVNQKWINPGDNSVNGVDDDGNGLVDDRSGWDFINNDRNPVDGDHHGTHIAGIIGATGNNNYATTGVSWDASLLPLQVCRADGGCPIDAMVNAIGYAGSLGVKVGNISVGGKVFSQARRDAIAAAGDILFVTSAGNEANDSPPGQGNNDTVSKYPCMDDQQPGFAALPNVICVASTDQNDLKSNFSNWGATTVDLAAPGSNILSTFPSLIYLFTDTFDTATSPWNYAKVDEGVPATPTGWERFTGTGSPASRGIFDSLNASGEQVDYAPTSDASTVTTIGVNLSEREGCRLQYNFRVDTEQPTANSFAGADVFYVEAANSASGPWTILDRWAGNTGPNYVSSTSRGSQATLEPFAKSGPVFIRFRLKADADKDVGDGASIDDVRMTCAGVASPAKVNYLSGTSMAAPQVSGIAALVRQINPGLSAGEVKAAVLAGVDVIPALNAGAGSPTPVVTGGRANLFNTLNGLDRTPPRVPQLLKPDKPVTTSARPNFTWKVAEPGATYYLTLDGNVVAAGAGLSSYKPAANLKLGRHTWSVRAVDHPGNAATSKSRRFTHAKAGKLKILSARPFAGRGGGAVLKVKVSGAGKVKAKARNRKKKLVALGAGRSRSAGRVKVRIKTTPKGRKLMKAAKLAVNLTVRFRPASGAGPVTARRNIKIHR